VTVSLPPSPQTHVLASVQEAPAPPPPVPAKRMALVIGINHAAGHRPLQGAVADATMLQKALVQYGFPEGNIIMLTDGAATTSRILSALDELAARSPADGRAVFSFAGHTQLMGGVSHFVAADGGLISAGTLASKLARVRAPMWVALPTCYAGGYALPGIVGPNRIATFASGAHSVSYELGSSGSWLMLYMVEYAMLDHEAPRSVEASFNYAHAAIVKVNPDREPFMVDRIPGDFVLGSPKSPSGSNHFQPPPSGDGVSGPSDENSSDETQPSGSSRGPIMWCRGVKYHCPDGG
jgi:hypothetical protein